MNEIKPVKFSELTWLYSRGKQEALDVIYSAEHELAAIKNTFLKKQPEIGIGSPAYTYGTDEERREIEQRASDYAKLPHLDHDNAKVYPNMNRVGFDGSNNVHKIVQWAAEWDPPLLQKLAKMRDPVPEAVAKLHGGAEAGVGPHLSAALEGQTAALPKIEAPAKPEITQPQGTLFEIERGYPDENRVRTHRRSGSGGTKTKR